MRPKYLQEVHGWAPAQSRNADLLIGGASRDHRQSARRAGSAIASAGVRSASIFAFGYAVALLAFYSVSGLLLPVLWIVYMFFSMGTDVTLSAYRAELFPTSMRSSASGATQFVSVTRRHRRTDARCRRCIGVVGSTWNAILIVASLTLLVPVAIWFLFPETARRSLDEIAPDKLVEPTLDK